MHPMFVKLFLETGADDLLAFETSLGEDHPPRFEPASALRSKFYNPQAVSRALQKDGQ